MGKRGNSNIEIDFINSNYELLSSGPAIPDHLGESITNVFMKIPESCRKKQRFLFSDGEPSYKSIVANASDKIIHVIQYHNKAQLGQISIQKYEKVGPHKFHYVINTHWKIFNKGSHVLKFKWEIKFIKGNEYKGRGRPRKNASLKNKNQKWRQKVSDYQNNNIKKKGTASVYINCHNKKVSMRSGSSKWMIKMLQPLFPIFYKKFITTGLIESKHHQIKAKGAGRKQMDWNYNHKLFTISAYIAENGFIPPFILKGSLLQKYIIKEEKSKSYEYDLCINDTKLIQSTLKL